MIFNITYSIEEPSTDVSHTVKSAPHTTFVAWETKHMTGDGSISTEINEAIAMKKQKQLTNQRSQLDKTIIITAIPIDEYNWRNIET